MKRSEEYNFSRTDVEINLKYFKTIPHIFAMFCLFSEINIFSTVNLKKFAEFVSLDQLF